MQKVDIDHFNRDHFSCSFADCRTCMTREYQSRVIKRGANFHFLESEDMNKILRDSSPEPQSAPQGGCHQLWGPPGKPPRNDANSKNWKLDQDQEPVAGHTLWSSHRQSSRQGPTWSPGGMIYLKKTRITATSKLSKSAFLSTFFLRIWVTALKRQSRTDIRRSSFSWPLPSYQTKLWSWRYNLPLVYSIPIICWIYYYRRQ